MRDQVVATSVAAAGAALLLINLFSEVDKQKGWLFSVGVVLVLLGPSIVILMTALRWFSQREARKAAPAELPSIFQVDPLHPDLWAATFRMAAEGCDAKVKGVIRYRRRNDGSQVCKGASSLHEFFGRVRRYVNHDNADVEDFPTCTIHLVKEATGTPLRHIVVEFSFHTSPPRARVRVGFDMPGLDRLPLHRQLTKSVSMIPGVSRLTGTAAHFP